MTANYHTHTKRCRHASGTEREYIETAVSRGLTTLGFSDHTPQIFPNGFVSNFRMAPEETAEYFRTLRELREETGYRCGKLTHIGDLLSSPAILSEVIHMYLAEGLTGGETDPDEDEFLELVEIPAKELKNQIIEGKIADAKTQAAVLKVCAMKGI